MSGPPTMSGSALTIGSLFSGIGGLELGLEMAGLGPVRWQVEINPGARAVLAAHWPEVTRHEDVRGVGAATLAAVDVVCGGFPCQDVSPAGKRVGLTGARSGLWFQYLRIVSELRPQWVVVENVAGGAHAWVDAVLTGLGELGYACLPVPLAAADVGAPHLRRRIFVVAHAERTTIRNESGRRSGSSWNDQGVATDHGEERQTAADADNSRREGPRTAPHEGRRRPGIDHWRSPVPDVLRVVDGLSGGLDAGARPRIAALGNAVVPQCAEVIGHVIQQLSAGSPP